MLSDADDKWAADIITERKAALEASHERLRGIVRGARIDIRPHPKPDIPWVLRACAAGGSLMAHTSIVVEGGMLPSDYLERIATGEVQGQRASDFGLSRNQRLTNEDSISFL